MVGPIDGKTYEQIMEDLFVTNSDPYTPRSDVYDEGADLERDPPYTGMEEISDR